MSFEPRLGALGSPDTWANVDNESRWYRIYGLDLLSQIELSFPATVPGQRPDVELLRAAPDFFEQATRGVVATPTLRDGTNMLNSTMGSRI